MKLERKIALYQSRLMEMIDLLEKGYHCAYEEDCGDYYTILITNDNGKMEEAKIIDHYFDFDYVDKAEVKEMLVGDLVYSDYFDCNCSYEIYDCTEDGKQWGDDAEVIFSSRINGNRPSSNICDMKIKYITTHANMIIIEATR